jgi:protein-L-isoaspartate(D-aspartate) O-methyltransferase
MGAVPRERFVPDDQRSRAYADNPLPIGDGQTISQPYIVALMTQLLAVDEGCDVLEVGTGSGYQTAILAYLAGRVWTIERFADLSARARTVLAALGIANVEFCVGDGSRGWPDPRRFDRIMITAAVPDFPVPLLAQLADRGRVVAPVGPGRVQELTVGEKVAGRLVERRACRCRFVKLLGEHGYQE